MFQDPINSCVFLPPRHKAQLPKYTPEELVFPGVKIESVAVDKLTTFFDLFEAEISNALPVKSQKEATDLIVKVRQHRLNHKPYTVHITVNSDKNVKSVVRIFLGPKYDSHGHELDITDNWMNFVELDQFVVDRKLPISSNFYLSCLVLRNVENLLIILIIFHSIL